jgi:hypothetical protein
MSTTRTLLDREQFIEALRSMGEDDLRFVNHMVVERLKLLEQAKSTVQLARFAEGDRVSFTLDSGEVKHGIIVRLNKKTASLVTSDNLHWKVSPSLLRKENQNG